MSRLRIADPDDPRLAEYRQLAGPDRLAERGLFVVESRHVLRRVLAAGRFRLRSVLLGEAAAGELAGTLAALDARVPLYVATKDVLSALAGFWVQQGCLAIAERGPAQQVGELIRCAREGAGRLVVLDRVANPDNVGGVFRNVQAFGADGVLLVGGGDPLYRKAVRVSLGATLELPFARADAWAPTAEALRAAGFTRVAAVSGAEAAAVSELAPRLAKRPVALVLGSEGEGLAPATLAHCDARIRVPMAPGVDSLNLATASGILLHHLSELS